MFEYVVGAGIFRLRDDADVKLVLSSYIVHRLAMVLFYLIAYV